jgi:uncharacterized damage-inducible protein DinB
MMKLERLFAYDDWANREEVARLTGIGAPPAAVRLLAHIIAAQSLWLARLRGGPPKMVVWPELRIDQCSSELEILCNGWREFLRGVDLDSKIEYRNSKGEPWSSSVDDVLTHVVMHGAYHRGQIATAVRQGGDAPAYTDYIHAARNGFV